MPQSPHLTREDYERLMRGELPPRQLVQQLFDHLLSHCPTCRAQWQRYCAAPVTTAASFSSAPDLQEDPEPAFDDLVRRAIARVQRLSQKVEREKAAAAAAYEDLKGLRRQVERVARIRRSQRFQTWALCEILLRKSRAKSFHSPDDAAERAELAIEVAWALDRGRHSNGTLSDLLARGWALLANARRVGSNLPLADSTFRMAEFFLQQGSGDPMVIGEVLDLLSSLRRDQRRFTEAGRLLAQVVRIYRRAGEGPLEGRATLSLAMVLGEAGEYERALRMVDRALTLVDEAEEPRVSLCCHHARTRLILKVGRGEEAYLEWQRLHHRYADFPETMIQLRRRWLEGEILEALGRDSEAEAAYGEVRSGFQRLEIPFDAALAALNLMVVYLRQGRTADTRALMEETLTVFRSLKSHREACTALELFQQSLMQDQATVEVARHLYRYLKQARRDPGMRYHPPP